jgi:CRISPR-associated protein Cas5d
VTKGQIQEYIRRRNWQGAAEGSLALLAWGPFACYSAVEAGPSRFSALVPTGAVVRAIFDAIAGHPGKLWWKVCEIHVLRPIQRITVVRNEVRDRFTLDQINKVLHGEHDVAARTPRTTVCLQDVAYVFVAQMVLEAGYEAKEVAYRNMFFSRVAKGKCHTRPYLGCREFAAGFCLPKGDEQPIDWTGPLGPQYFDVTYPGGVRNATTQGRVCWDPVVDHGVIRVPGEIPNRWRELSGGA